MNGKYFLDTNVFVYSFQPDEPEKQSTAQELIRIALKEQAGCISSQVIQEFLNVASKKFTPPLSSQDCLRYLNTVMAPLCEVFSSLDLFRKTIEIRERWKYTLYDSMIITAALQANCTVLYSEDLHHGQQIESLVIVNPFIS
ncbi:MAG: PIN domain-containing protein [Candidatus Electrothrix sp. AUS1_2]|nr:PIN domain-containing protein [Candidatus Electrothrix sp. AUS1_2]